jgi:NTP pyrophosphatase (non-canonical NTP hydrolase)
MEMNEYQQRAASTDIRPDPSDVSFPLLGLAGEVGTLVAEYKKSMRSGEMYVGFRDQVAEELGDLLWYIGALARTCGLSLNDIAERNLEKTALAWGSDLPPPNVYDEGFPDDERLPRKAILTFTSDPQGLVRLFMGPNAVGDPLDDNAYEEDHYRFHDALHLANAAVLGWSPLTRSLLKRKRQSRPEIDRVEDGARAIFLEEGLVAYVFSEAERRGFFENTDRVDWELLKTVQRISNHLEVGNQPPAVWQSAILQGYNVWRQLRANGGGSVTLDLDTRSFTYAARPEER